MPHAAALSLDSLTALRGWAAELGFLALGVARAELPPAAARRLADWLAQGWHGEMDYMARHADLRVAPEKLQPGVRSVISVLLPYWPEPLSESIAGLADGRRAYVSRYALGRDYHKSVRGRLAKLATRMTEHFGAFKHRAFSDSAPVMEVEFARQAGLGWRGKHDLLLTKQGSTFFLGELYTDLPLPDAPPALLVDDAQTAAEATPGHASAHHCGRCRACLDACPSGAIVEPYRVDARRCISYLTIEFSGSIPLPLRPLIGNRIYGCDDCQLCCPWNRFARLGDPDFLPRHGLDRATLLDLLAWGPEDFAQKLTGSPIRRIGYEQWLRNLAVALGNRLAASDAAEAAALCAALRQKRAATHSALAAEHLDWALDQKPDR